MKKIVLAMEFYALPVPSVMGGGIEELMTILINENERQNNPDEKIIFLMPELYGKRKKFKKDFTFKNTEVIKIKYNRLRNFLIRAINRILKLLKIDFKFENNYYKRLYKVLKKIEPDLIIFEGEFDVGIGRFTKTFGKEKLGFHIHYQMLNKLDISKYFGSLISVSKFIDEDWKKFLPEDSKINRYVLSNCVNEERFNKVISVEERNEIRTKLGFDEGDFVVVFCGRIQDVKGVKELIEAVVGLPKNIKLLIIGGVNSALNEKEQYICEIEKLSQKHSDKVKFSGYIKNSELYRYYQSADLQAIPSKWEEAAGLVVVEGELCGLPQIITNSGGMREFANPDSTIVIERGKELTQNIKNAILKVYNMSEKERKAISSSNRKYAARFNQKAYYDNFKIIIDKILKKEEM